MGGDAPTLQRRCVHRQYQLQHTLYPHWFSTRRHEISLPISFLAKSPSHLYVF